MSAVLKPAIDFRPLLEADLPAVMAIEAVVYPFPWSEGNFRDSLAAGYYCLACEQGGALIAYAVMMFAADEAHLLNLSVAGEAQRHGHGGAMLARLCDYAHSGGARLMYLEVRPSNAAALRLYERSGFSRVGVRRDYYPAHEGREDAIVLSLPL